MDCDHVLAGSCALAAVWLAGRGRAGCGSGEEQGGELALSPDLFFCDGEILVIPVSRPRATISGRRTDLERTCGRLARCRADAGLDIPVPTGPARGCDSVRRGSSHPSGRQWIMAS